VIDGTALWLGARGFVVRDVIEDGEELVVAIETTNDVPVGCSGCGTPARAKDRRRVRLRDAPVGDRPVQLEWHKRIWSCPDPDCAMKTWTEQRPEFALPRRVLTVRAARWTCTRVAALEGTPASCARTLGVSWATTWRAVAEHGTPLVENPHRVGVTVMVGFDETVMQPAHRRRRRRFVTAVVDVTSGQILDVFEGRDAKDLAPWLAGMPRSWRAGVQVVSVDPHEGYRKALTGTSLLGDVTMVVDPFHIVRLANMAVTRCRQRVQQATLGHRGHAHDPLFASRKLFLLGAERVDDRGWNRIWSALREGDPDGELQDTWVAKEKVRDVYLTDDPAAAAAALDDAIAWCSAPEAGHELRRLAKTLHRWRTEILAHHSTGASNGPVEAANLLIKQVKRAGRGFRNFTNYRLRILLAGGLPRDAQPVTRLRARPSFVA
jgi:transposase